MGAKTGLKLRTRGIAYKCDVCGRKLMSPDALIIHQRTAHNIISRRNKTIEVYKPPKKQVKEKVKEPPASENKSVGSKDQTRSVEFKCPKCFKLFESYLQAQKHIQDFHRPKNKEIRRIVKPERLELCKKCKQMVRSLPAHVCDTIRPLEINRGFICGACGVTQGNLRSFQVHIIGSHIDGVQSLFFPSSTDFTEWKTDMQCQTNTNYVYYERTDAKKFYHCNHIMPPEEEGGPQTFCPSMMTVQEFSKGLQVHFYKNHFKHKCNEYKLSDKFNRFSINSFFNSSLEYQNLSKLNYPDPNDLYVQFKTLLEGIIVDAAKVNVTALRVLLGKGLEMTSILSKYKEENEEVNTYPLTDEEISSVLQTGKRNVDDIVPTEIKRPKLVFDQSPKIVNSFSLAANLNTNGTPKEDEVIEKTDEEEGKERDPYSSAFNDSYKDFVVKNFPIPEEEKKKLKKRQVLKTKMGQFKPITSPKNGEKIVEPVRETRSSKANASNADVTIIDKNSVRVKVERKIKKIDMENLKHVEKPHNTRGLRWEKLSNEEKVSNVAEPNDLEKVSDLEKSSNEEKESTVEKPSNVEKVSAVKKPNVRKLSIVEKVSSAKKPSSIEKVILRKTNVDKVGNVEKLGNVEKIGKLEKVGNVVKVGKVEKVDNGEKPKQIVKNVLPRLSLEKPTVDPEYEVMEQEGDCNILILKI